MDLSSPMYGRSTELDAVSAVLSGLDRDDVPLVEVTGDPGLGKTRLLAEAAVLAKQRGLVVLWGRAEEAERYAPFFPLADALTDHLAEAGAVVMDRLVMDSPYLATLMTAFPDVRSVSGITLPFGKASRHCLFRAARTLVERLTWGRGAVLILDDVHWADEYSIGLLDFLHTHPARAPVGVLFAYRPRQAPARLMAVTSRPTFRKAVLSMALRPLGRLDIGRLTGCRTKVGEVYERSGGNPFYAQMYAQSAPEVAGRLTDEAGLRVGGPLAHVILDELDRATPVAVVAAEAAAVTCDDVSVVSVAAAAAVTEAQAEAGVEELVWRDILRREDAAVRFRHPLVRAAVVSRVPAAWCRAAQARAATARRVEADQPTPTPPAASADCVRLRLLTAREWEVARSVGEGLTNKQIARRLGVSDKTIEAHLAKIFSKLGVGSRVAVASLVARGMRSEDGLADPCGHGDHASGEQQAQTVTEPESHLCDHHQPRKPR